MASKTIAENCVGAHIFHKKSPAQRDLAQVTQQCDGEPAATPGPLHFLVDLSVSVRRDCELMENPCLILTFRTQTHNSVLGNGTVRVYCEIPDDHPGTATETVTRNARFRTLWLLPPTPRFPSRL